MYKLTYRQFYYIKRKLDGHVFWRQTDTHVIVLQIAPYDEITDLLIKISKLNENNTNTT